MQDELNIDESRNKAIIIGSSVAGVLLLAIIVILFAVAGGDDKKSDSAKKREAKVKSSSTSTSSSKVTTTTSSESFTSITTTTMSKTATTSSSIRIMPYVICETTASAQSKIKSTGSDEPSFVDGDGERTPGVDGNWIVTLQYPEPGESFDNDAVLHAIPRDELSEGECE